MTQEAENQFHSVEQLSKELSQLCGERTIELPGMIEVYFNSPQVAICRTANQIRVIIKERVLEAGSTSFVRELSNADKVEIHEGDTILYWRVRHNIDDAYGWLLSKNAFELIEQLNEAVRERAVVITDESFTNIPQREGFIYNIRIDLACSLYDLLTLEDLGVN